MKLKLAALASFASLALATSARAAELFPQQPLFAFEVDPHLTGAISSALEKDGNAAPIGSLGGGLGGSFRIWAIRLGVEDDRSGLGIPDAPNAQLSSFDGFLGAVFQLSDRDRLEVRVRGGRHHYFGVSSGFQHADPVPNRFTTPFAGAQLRLSTGIVHWGHAELRGYGALGADLDRDTTTLIADESGLLNGATIKMGGFQVALTFGVELAVF